MTKRMQKEIKFKKVKKINFNEFNQVIMLNIQSLFESFPLINILKILSRCQSYYLIKNIQMICLEYLDAFFKIKFNIYKIDYISWKTSKNSFSLDK
jgi:hypothetical protein